MTIRPNTKTHSFVITGLLSSMLVMGCAIEEDAINDSDNFGVMRDNVHVVDDVMMEGASVQDAALLFPVDGAWLRDVRVGDILISGVGLGYLRRVTDIVDDGGMLRFDTEQAHLDEALSSASLNQSLYSEPNTAGLVVGRFAEFGIEHDFSGTVLYAQDGLEVTIPEGFVSFKPTMDIDLDIGLFRGVDFEMVANGELDARLVVQANASRSFTEAFSFRRTLFTSPTVRVPLQVGPVPLTLAITSYIDGNFEIGAGVSGSASVGADTNIDVTAGFRYDNGFDLIHDADLKFTPIAPTYEVAGHLTATASLSPRLEVLILNSAGPTVGVEAYVKLSADGNIGSGGAPAANCQVLTGLRGDLGGKLSIFNLIDVANIDFELFDINRTFGCLPQ